MKWVILAMALDRQYYKVGTLDIEQNEYRFAVAEAYLLEGEGKLDIPFEWMTIWCIPDDLKYKDLYKEKWNDV